MGRGRKLGETSLMLRFVRTAVCSAILVAAATPTFAQGNDPLAPARQGQVQCYEPDVARKTCQSIGSFEFQENGVIQNTAVVLVMPNPVVIMRIVSPVTVRDGGICGPLKLEDINGAQFMINGQPATETDTQRFRTQFAQQMSPLIDVETCISLTPADGGFRADTAMNGRVRPELAQQLIWIRPEDGYTIAPPAS